MLKTIDRVMDIVKQTHIQGQKEYAHDTENVFANFERVALSLDISKEKALMVYLMKHMDGINAYIKGHKSQREDVTGRIKDAIVYLCLLWGMVDDDKVQPHITSFNPKTGEVKYVEQSTGDEVV